MREQEPKTSIEKKLSVKKMKVEIDRATDKQVALLLRLARSSKLEDYLLNLLLRQQIHKLTREQAEKLIDTYIRAIAIAKQAVDESIKKAQYNALVKELNLLGVIQDEHR